MDNNLVGQTIQGRYYVVRQLGRGGVGVTFLAQDRQCFDSPCVVKQLKPKTANSQTLAVARRLFNREAEIMNRLGHCDRIPRLLAYFEQDNEFFLVQELIEGHDLSEEILPGKPWSLASTLTLLQDTLEVLVLVHQHSVIHRDIKPSNLMRRTLDNKIVLIDFGSVKQVSTQIIDTAGGIKQTVAVGTETYMPMEQMMGRPGFYSDIYALGIIAIQALTGIHPKKLPIDDNGEIVWRDRLSHALNYPPRFLDLLDRMVRYRFQERYNSAGVVLSDLKQLDTAQNNNKKTIIVGRDNSNSQPAPTSRAKVNKETAVIHDREEAVKKPTKSIAVVGNKIQVTPLPVKPQAGKRSQLGFKALPVIVIAIAIAGLGGWILNAQRNKQSELELSPYQDRSQGFQVNYPQDWSKENRDDFFATGVIFVSPLVDNADRFQENVSVLVEELPNDLSLPAYTEQSLAEIRKLSDPNVGEAREVTLGTYEARQIVYQGEENGSPVQRMQVWSVNGDRVYVLTYTAIPEDYARYLPTVEKMIESFETIQ